jgi:hypothetical protein
VIAGAATAASGRVAHRQQQKLARNDRLHAPPAATASNHHGSDIVDSLRQLAELKASGALSEKEYTTAKARVLDGG